MAINWKFYQQWNVNTQVNWVLDRKRAPEDNRPAIDDYKLINLTLGYHTENKRLNFSFAIRNLFDSDAREPSPWSNPSANIPNDLPLSGRHFFATTQFNF